MNIGKLVITIGVNDAALDRAAAKMATLGKATDKLRLKMTRLGKQMKATGRMMTTYLTMPMALVGAAAVKLQMDFEASMAKIVGLVGVARKTVQAWAEDVKKLAPSVGRAPEELADALYFITSAGIRGSEAMEVLEESAKAAAAGMGDTKLIADLVTSAMNAYGKEVLSAAEATDILAETVKEGKSEAALLASTMGMVLPIAAAMGVTFDQVGAAGAAMTRTGTVSATAFMQLRQMLNSLLDPAQMAEQALNSMGTSSEELRDTIRTKGLLAALMDINKLIDVFGENVMGKVFPNIRALSGTLDILGKNLENNIVIFDNLKNATGRNEKAFQAAAETTKFKFNKAITNLKVGLIELGESMKELVIPLFEKFSSMISSSIKWFKSLSQVQQQLILKIAGIVLVLGPLVTMLGFLIANILPALIFAFTNLAGVVLGLWTLFTASPIGVLLVVIAGLTLAVTKLIQKHRGLTGEVEKAAKAQDKYNKLLEAGNKIAIKSATTAERAGGVSVMSKDQLADLEQTMWTQLVAERKHTKDLRSILEERERQVEEIGTVYLSSLDVDELAEYYKRTSEGISISPQRFINTIKEKIEESEALTKDLEKAIDTTLAAERKLLHPQEEINAGTLELMAKAATIAKLKAEGLVVAAAAVQKGYDALAAAIFAGEERKKYGAPDTIGMGKAENEFQTSMKNISDMKGVSGYKPMEETLKAYLKLIEDLTAAGAKTSNVELLGFKLAPERLDLIREYRDELEDATATYNKLLKASLTGPDTDAIKLANDEYIKEMARIEGKVKDRLPGFNAVEAKVSALNTVINSLFDADAKWDNPKLIGYIEQLRIELQSLENIDVAEVVTGIMRSLDQSLESIDAEAEKQLKLGKIIDTITPKLVAYEKAQAAINMLPGDHSDLLAELALNMGLLGDESDIAKIKVANMMKVMEGKLDKVDFTAGLYEDLAEIGGSKNVTNYLEKLGITFDVTKEKMRIYQETLKALMAIAWLPGMDVEAAIKRITKEMANLPKSAETMKNEFLSGFTAILSAMQGFVNAMMSLVENQKQRELSAVGQNAKKREEIEKEYFEKQKKWAIAQANIQIAMSILQALGSLKPPWSFIVAGIAAAAGAVQLAAIQAQTFADGGIVYGETMARVGEYAGARSNPEVIAPLDRLVSILKTELFGGMATPYGQSELTGIGSRVYAGFDRGARKEQKVVFEIEGSKLSGVLLNYGEEFNNL